LSAFVKSDVHFAAIFLPSKKGRSFALQNCRGKMQLPNGVPFGNLPKASAFGNSDIGSQADAEAIYKYNEKFPKKFFSIGI